MSSHPPGLRFSPFSSAATQSANNTNKKINNNTGNSNNNIVNNKLKMQQQSQQQQIQQQQQSQQGQIIKTKPTFNNHSTNSFSDSETDLSNSIENLSMEERFVLRHTARVEPQGQENLQDNLIPGRYSNDNRLSSNASTDSTRYASSNRSMSETRNPIYSQPQIQSQQANNNNTNPNNNSNRNSLKEANSNRSSMDVSTCSYNTLIIHNDDSMYSSTNDYTSPPPNHPFLMKKDRPRSYGEKGMQEITEIPDDYLDQSHVLKHLAKDVKIQTNKSDSTARDSGLSENTDSKDQNYANNNNTEWIVGENEQNQSNKIKSKSQPDLTRLGEIDLDTVEGLMKENAYLKQQLQNCLLKVAKTQKLEDEVANIYRAHEELEQSCQRREKLELTIRTKLQNEIHRAQELNRVLRDQVDVLQSQLLAPSEHQILIAQLFTQNKELTAAKERQEIELAAQRATLQEQRNHIGILDSALTNTQNNMRRLEEESRKKQIYIEHLLKLQQNSLQSKQNERKMRLEYDNELSKDSNRSGSSTNSDSKWQLHDKDGQILRLENECAKLEQQRHLEESAIRQSAAKIVMEKNSQEADRIIAEAKQEKLRYLEEVHSAQRKVSELQNHLKGLESRLAEKDALIRVLQGQKNYGSSNSYDSYNLSNESFALNPLVYNSQASFNVSNSSFNTTANTSLLEPSYGQNSSSFNPATSYGGGYGSHVTNAYGQTTPTAFNQSALNLQAIANYGQNSSNYNTNYVSNSNYSPNNNNYETAYEHHQYDAARKSIDDHMMKKQFDEQLSKVSHNHNKHHHMVPQPMKGKRTQSQDISPNNNIILNQIQASKEMASSARDITKEKETFY